MKKHLVTLNSIYWIVILFFIYCTPLFGQNRSIIFDSNFHVKGSKQIDPNELYVLSGTLSHNISRIKVNATTLGALKSEVKGLQQNENSWSVIVGPFLPKQTILFEFEITRVIDEKAKMRILQLSKEAFFATLPQLPKKMDPNGFIVILKNILDNTLSSELKEYTDNKGVSLKEQFIKTITEGDIKNMLNILNLLLETKENQDVLNQKLDLLKKNNEKTSKLLNQINLVMNLKTNQLNDPAYKNNLDEIKALDPTTNQYINVIIDDLNSVDKLIDDILNTSAFSKKDVIYCNDLQSDFLNTDIKEYIGIDLMPALYGPGRPGIYSMFLTFSPYFGRTDPNEKLIDQSFLKSLQRIVTPTVGLGIVNSPVDSTLHKFMAFVGVSARINKLIRISTGGTFYSKKKGSNNDNPPKLLSAWTFGIGLDIEYLAEVLKIISSTTKQFNP